MSLTVIVCGGRNYRDRVAVTRVLDALHEARRISILLHGGAAGADSLADHWAMMRGVDTIVVPALWAHHGRSAGPIRNRLMLQTHDPDLVVAFPGGTGTADMVRQAKAAKVRVVQVGDVEAACAEVRGVER